MKLVEIFNSIDGEVNHFGQGYVTVFVRFAGCNLNCHYCDTKKSLKVNNSWFEMSLQQVIQKIKRSKIKKVTITGGEPLIQLQEFIDLVNYLISNNYKLTVETNGTIDIPKSVADVNWVVDYKFPSIPKFKRMKEKLYISLTEKDFIKFIIENENDFDNVYEIINRYRKNGCKSSMALSPIVSNNMNERKLFKLLERKMIENIVINSQLHKHVKLN